jgi:hypothetical protein
MQGKKPESTTQAMVKTPPHQKPLPIPPLESGDSEALLRSAAAVASLRASAQIA